LPVSGDLIFDQLRFCATRVHADTDSRAVLSCAGSDRVGSHDDDENETRYSASSLCCPCFANNALRAPLREIVTDGHAPHGPHHESGGLRLSVVEPPGSTPAADAPAAGKEVGQRRRGFASSSAKRARGALGGGERWPPNPSPSHPDRCAWTSRTVPIDDVAVAGSEHQASGAARAFPRRYGMTHGGAWSPQETAVAFEHWATGARDALGRRRAMAPTLSRDTLQQPRSSSALFARVPGPAVGTASGRFVSTDEFS
jgi:hypothetical protein